MVYKHAISTVVPSRVVRLPLQNPAEEESSD
jgi:host factor-I protein